jgi:hypothetical protein
VSAARSTVRGGYTGLRDQPHGHSFERRTFDLPDFL